MCEGLEARRIKGRHCVFLYGFDALGWMCDRLYHDGSGVPV